uniref:LEM domain-containing protein n=1 Tax=Panagrolaimus sp. PS1159 TaxID=55785 RepID=A0AC35F4C0_9BILA
MPTEEENVSTKYPFHLALHYLAGSSSVIALDHAKRLLDSKTHQVDFQNEETGFLTPLHIASHWGNLAMCQLLIHYNANPDAKDEDGNTPLLLAENKKVRRFLKKMSPTSKPYERKRIRIILNELFRFKSISFRKKKQREKQRPVSCGGGKISAFIEEKEEEMVIKRRSSMLTEEFNAKTEHDVQKIIASLSIEDKKMEVKENLIPEISKNEKRTPAGNVTPRIQSAQRNEFKKTPTAPPIESDTNDEEEEVLPRTPDVPLEIRQLSLEQLKKRLEKVGISPGPMKKDTRKIYEKRLLVAEKQNVEAYKNQDYSNALDKVLRILEKGGKIQVGQIQEDIVRNEFCLGPIITREKNEVSSFCYILIDPSKIPDQRNCTFRQFVDAAFYVGKGKRHRPLQHLIDAAKCKRQENFRGKPISDKLKRICKLWRNGHGVVSLHVFLNIHPNEALIREAAMIDAFGVKNLTNLKGGEYSGNSKTWSLKEKTEFGSLCIYSAWGVFKNDRCRPIFESDVADALNQKIFY